MNISYKFSNFCTALRMSETTVSNIRCRAKQITKRVNSDFRGIDSDTRYSLFVGSYGRGTDIHVSDIDMILELPYSEYEKYDNYTGNGQSALIQAVKDSIKKTYSTTHVSGDGQVVKLNFQDGICYEIVPGFINEDGSSYIYPDSNSGGSWKVTKSPYQNGLPLLQNIPADQGTGQVQERLMGSVFNLDITQIFRIRTG